MRREYGGAVPKAALVTPLGGTPADLIIVCDDLTGWPPGDDPYFIVLDRTKPTEEKILVGSRAGNILSVWTDGVSNGRGADGTAITAHALGAIVEHIYTATDADEANLHVNSGTSAHGWEEPHQLLGYARPGVLAVTIGVGQPFMFPYAVTILGISAVCRVAPTGADIVFDVNKNGTTIFTTQANRPRIVASAFKTASEVTNMDITAYAALDVLTPDVDQVGSGVSGSDTTLTIRYKKV